MIFPSRSLSGRRSRGARAAGVLLSIGLALTALAPTAAAQEPESVLDLPRVGHEPCVQGWAGPFRCDNVDLMTFLPISEMGGGPGSRYGGAGNDVWGWTDPLTGKEWAIAGRSNGTSFIDMADAKNPVFVANLPAAGVTELHSDMKVYKDHAFIVKDHRDNGIQVFDLTRLRGIDYANAPVDVDADALYTGISNAHDIVINEDSGFAYAVGATRDVEGVPACHDGGLHMVDIRDPKDPTYAGCYDEDGYTHDAQCVIYHGPDADYQGRELCFNANPNSMNSVGGNDALTIVDVTDKSNPVLVSATFEGEPNTYSHQGWVTDDHRYYLHDDESDNGASSSAIPGRSRTRVFDVTDLDNPDVQAVYHHPTRAPVHNLYIRDRYMYNSNYIDGLRIVDITKIDHPGDEFLEQTAAGPDHQGLREVGCFDVDPFRDDMGEFPSGGTAWGGTWSNYPYFKSGVVVVSGFDGLFLVKPRLGITAASPPAAGKNPPAGNAGGNRSNVCLPDDE